MQETASCTVAVCDSSKVAYAAFLGEHIGKEAA
jgi:hypothetical protein